MIHVTGARPGKRQDQFEQPMDHVGTTVETSGARSGAHPVATINVLAVQIRAVARTKIGAVSGQEPLLTLSLEPATSGAVLFRASVWLVPNAAPLTCTGDTALTALLALYRAVQACVRTPSR